MRDLSKLPDTEEEVVRRVTAEPGHTAYWYAGSLIGWLKVRDTLNQAVAKGLLSSDGDPKAPVYYPANIKAGSCAT